MPTEIQLQFHKGTGRWRKKINGKDYYFCKGANKSDLTSYRQAYQEYLALKVSLESKSPALSRLNQARTLAQAKATFLQRQQNLIRRLAQHGKTDGRIDQGVVLFDYGII